MLKDIISYFVQIIFEISFMGADDGWVGWACAHPGKNVGGHCPP